MINNVLKLFLLFVFFLFSFFISIEYVNGDQLHYRAFYKELKNVNLSNLLDLSINTIGSNEIVYPYLSFFFANLGIDKEIYISIFNTLFLITIIKSFKKFNKKNILILPLLLTNYYFIVLCFSAERLKFGFLFAFISMLFYKNLKTKYFYITLSLLSHYQMIIFWFSYIIFNAAIKYKKILKTSKTNIFYFLIITIIFSYFSTTSAAEVLIYKFNAYREIGLKNTFDVYLRPILLLIVFIYTSKRFRFEHFVLFISFLPFYHFFGGDRINIIYFLLSLILILRERDINYAGIYMLLTYFSLSGIDFVYDIILHGTGY